MHNKASWACNSEEVEKKRQHCEVFSSSVRNAFQRDRDRILHSQAFRRLKHKTQVFIAPEQDHFRTRLTHSLEVAQIARTLARYFHADEDLTEAVALAHDLGHPPFGHAGEKALDQCMKSDAGFDHNIQTLRVVTKLENAYIDFKGLNLCRETLQSIAKHNGPIEKNKQNAFLKKLNASIPLSLSRQMPMEGQFTAIADDIAYNHHDIEDGLRAKLFTLKEICNNVPYLKQLYADLIKKWTEKDVQQMPRVLIRAAINETVNNVIAQTQKNLENHHPKTIQEIEKAKIPFVVFDNEMAKNQKILKTFLSRKMYQAPSIEDKNQEVKKIIDHLFDKYLNKPELLSDSYKKDRKTKNTNVTNRHIADYIAGMTDQFAIRACNDKIS